MFFFNFGSFRLYCMCATCILLGVLALKAVRSKKLLIKVPVEFGSVVLVLLGLIAGVLFFGLGELTESHSAAIYSPDRKHAIRVENSDEGAVGGSTFVVLYSVHGLRTDMIFLGEGGAIQAKDIYWISNEAVLVSYHHPSQPPRVCASARGVTVRCEQALEAVQ
jgi:hypothetical protein